MGLGGSPCPWELHAHPGQRINITLFDFMVAERYKTGGGGGGGAAGTASRGGGTSGERFCQVSGGGRCVWALRGGRHVVSVTWRNAFGMSRDERYVIGVVWWA